MVRNVNRVHGVTSKEARCEGLVFHLESRPVHMHVRAMVIAEPLQVLLCVCSQDCALQFSVYCRIAEDRRTE